MGLPSKGTGRIGKSRRPESNEYLRGTAVGADQDFEAFLREWTKERIWAVDDFLDYRDRRYMEERRAAELTRLAAAKGFSDDLTRTVEPFGNSVLQYVTHLFYMASVNARSPAPDTWK
jgi:hypothetical protein